MSRRPSAFSYQFGAVLCALLLSGFILHPSALASTLYVDGIWGSNAWDGASATFTNSHGPKLNISAAINTASNGDTLVIASGFYQETNWNPGVKSLTIVPAGSVTIYGSDPWQTDSDGDGMVDAWEVAYGLDAFSTNGVNGATGDADSDGISNLDEYLAGTDPTNPDVTPPTITATISPAPNAAGWNTNNVTVTFSASDPTNGVVSSGLASVSGGATFTGETNDAEVVGIARDNAGNVATTSVLVNIDKTPPTVRLDPGSGEQFDNSHPLLIVEYYDTNGVASSGLNLDTLAITLNGTDVTTNFYRFGNRALLATNLPANLTNVWTATIADYAGHSVTSTVSFSSSGASNPEAPVLSALNAGDYVLMPDVAEIWIQGKVSGQGSTVSASVNGEQKIPLNRRDDDFGYLLPLEYGTNVVVLVADDGEGKLSSKLLRVERTDKYQAAITAPAFGTFANGVAQTIQGYVSAKYAAGTAEELGLAGASLNGVAVTLTAAGNGIMGFALVVPGTNCSVMPLIMELCWTNANGVQVFPGATAALAACPKIPLGLLEGYEIVSKVAHYRKDAPTLVGSSVWWPPAFWIDYNATNGPCAGQWVIVRAKKQVEQESFSMPCTATETNSVLDDTTYAAATNCVAVPALTNITAWVVSSYWSPYYGTVYETTHTEQHLMQPLRSLRFGRLDAYSDQVRDEPADGVVDSISREIGWIKDEGELVVRWPFYYAAGQVVLLTFEGVDYTRVAGEEFVGTNVLYQGQAPVAVSGHDLSYLVVCPGGGTPFTLNAAAFDWPESEVATNYVEAEWGDRLWIRDGRTTAHHLTFTGFHNDHVRDSIEVMPIVGVLCASPWPPGSGASGKYSQPPQAKDEPPTAVNPETRTKTTSAISYLQLSAASSSGSGGYCNSVVTNCNPLVESSPLSAGELTFITKGLPPGAYNFKVSITLELLGEDWGGVNVEFDGPTGAQLLHPSPFVNNHSPFPPLNTNIVVTVNVTSPASNTVICTYNPSLLIQHDKRGKCKAKAKLTVEPAP